MRVKRREEKREMNTELLEPHSSHATCKKVHIETMMMRVLGSGSNCFLNNFFISKYMLIMFFLFFKNYFWHQYIETIQNIQTILNFSKKKLIFLKTQFISRSQTYSTTKPRKPLLDLRSSHMCHRITVAFSIHTNQFTTLVSGLEK